MNYDTKLWERASVAEQFGALDRREDLRRAPHRCRRRVAAAPHPRRELPAQMGRAWCPHRRGRRRGGDRLLHVSGARDPVLPWLPRRIRSSLPGRRGRRPHHDLRATLGATAGGGARWPDLGCARCTVSRPRRRVTAPMRRLPRITTVPAESGAAIPLVKLVASALTIGSGGSGGREGPTAQISAGFGSVSGQNARSRSARCSDRGGGRHRRQASGRSSVRRLAAPSSGPSSSIATTSSPRPSSLHSIATIVAYLDLWRGRGVQSDLRRPGRLRLHEPGSARLVSRSSAWRAAWSGFSTFGASTVSPPGSTHGRHRGGSSPQSPGCMVGCIGAPASRSPRHRLRFRPGWARPAYAPRHPGVDDPRATVRQDPRHLALDRLGRFGRHLRSRDVHRRNARGGHLAAARADCAGDPGRPGAVRHRRHDGVVRERRACTPRRDAHGCRDDRQPLDARPSDGGGRPRHIRRRLEVDLPQPAGHSG